MSREVRFISISLRLTLWFAAIFFCASAVFGAAMWMQLRNTLRNERRQTLSRRADRLQELLRRDDGQAHGAFAADFREFAHATGNGLAEIFLPDHQRAFPSPSAAAANFPWPVLPSNAPETFLQISAGRQPYSVFVRPLMLDGHSAWIYLAAPNGTNVIILHDFWRGLLAWIPVVLVVSSAGGYWMSRRALQPVDRITAAARSISIGNLSDRLQVNNTGDELQRLTETFNAMLQRLQESVSRMNQFTADASHELRGPLSFTRTVAEVALRNPGIDVESRESFQEIVDEAAKAANLLEQMLTLARADAEPQAKHLEAVELSDIVSETCTTARMFAEERGLRLTLSMAEWVAPIRGDASSLRRLVWILVDNALKYTSSNGTIGISLSGRNDCVCLCVRNTGPAISPTDLPHLFDRFYRADPSRSQVEGSGLGLAIGKWIAEMHHATISVQSDVHTGTVFLVEFPAAR